MPVSLVTSSPTLRGVTRNESTRSDSSAASNTSQSSVTGNKKVSFNKAVRVKKYPRPRKNENPSYGSDKSAEGAVNGDVPGSSGKRFWFKVYKNKHRQSPDPSEFRRQNGVIYYDNDVNDTNGYDDDTVSYHPNPCVLNYPVLTSECGTQTPNRRTDGTSSRTALLGNEYTPLHPSQMPSDPPAVRRNYVKKIVNKFNEEAVLQRSRSPDREPASPPISPPGSPRFHSTPKHIPIPPPPPPPIPPSAYERPSSEGGLFSQSRFKKNPIVNGVKVMFGIGQLKKGEKSDPYRDLSEWSDTPMTNGDGKYPKKGTGLYRTEIPVRDESDTEVKTPFVSNDKFLFGDVNHHNEIVKREDKLDFAREKENHADDDFEEYYYQNEDDRGRKSKYHVETFDSGNQLLFDTTDVNTATGKTDKGEFTSTVGEKHQLWRNNKRIIVYEEQSPTIIRRKAKSHSDLTEPEIKYPPEEKLDKGISTDELFTRKSDTKDTLSKKNKDSWFRHFRSATKDKGIQCSKIPTDEPEELYGFGRYKIIRPRNGVVSAFSNVPTLETKTKKSNGTTFSQTNGYNSKDSVIYSQIDKSKKKKNSEKEKKKHNMFHEEGRFGGLFKSRSEPLYIGPPPPKSQQQEEDELESNYFEDRGERTVKTSRKSFGFRLNTGKENKTKDMRSSFGEEDWYNLDGDIEAAERQKRRGRSHRDISEIRQELAEEEISDTSSLSNGDLRRNGHGTGSVMREVDYKKREISYENVPRSDGENHSHANVGTGLWYRDADEDYRREMAQSEVSYPAGNSVGSERFYTVDRKDKANKKLPPPSPRAYTLDRRHLKNKDKQKQVANTSGVKILVNGKEIKDKSGKKSKKREDPSSVQSDPMYVRGGLAAAYQARQRAAVRRSNSTASGLSGKYRGNSPNVRRIVANSSELSAASSESDSSRLRRPLVMYIPGVSHQEKVSDQDDRLSNTIARSQSMKAPVRPPRMVKKSNLRAHKGSKTDLYRNDDIYEDDEIMPLASDTNRKKPPKVPSDSRKHNDIKRRHSMPKDTKFSWLKWRIRGKPSREP
ncbi:uncharacterized protein LOC129234213 [Uloborus diversus]|uniref:uncharacterized protein LOC129234213 n=1 Tax=Uloborus diversus TaxID=327109 RepID=UPI002409869A|nr:uncharacterized protein LOC129234213 [Uloborus diversus]